MTETINIDLNLCDDCVRKINEGEEEVFILFEQIIDGKKKMISVTINRNNNKVQECENTVTSV